MTKKVGKDLLLTQEAFWGEHSRPPHWSEWLEREQEGEAGVDLDEGWGGAGLKFPTCK